MKIRMVSALVLLAMAAAAPAQESADQPAAAGRGERAPLAVPDDLAPAVDVSRPTAGGAPPAAQQNAAPAQSPVVAGTRSATIDTLDLGTTSITGNQELPKVLYIVPWKSSDLGDLAGRPVNTLLDEVLSPIDPEVFERQLKYFDSLYGTTGKE